MKSKAPVWIGKDMWSRRKYESRLESNSLLASLSAAFGRRSQALANRLRKGNDPSRAPTPNQSSRNSYWCYLASEVNSHKKIFLFNAPGFNSHVSKSHVQSPFKTIKMNWNATPVGTLSSDTDSYASFLCSSSLWEGLWLEETRCWGCPRATPLKAW